MLLGNVERLRAMKDGQMMAHTIGAKLLRVQKEMQKLKEAHQNQNQNRSDQAAEDDKAHKKPKRSQEDEEKARAILACASHWKMRGFGHGSAFRAVSRPWPKRSLKGCMLLVWA